MAVLDKAVFSESTTIRWPRPILIAAKKHCAKTGWQFASFVREATRLHLEAHGAWPLEGDHGDK
ncbi:MAG: hypothetical protein HN348_31035 [Proteobacteria bacterium]|nr:hypothetical protein [Pseudomonadota bacterium]